ncbi:hypothetical protein QCE62_29305 [Caballeronia sp. LZ033]|nr:hypothetical protein [Caballeronia sp. LZ033]
MKPFSAELTEWYTAAAFAGARQKVRDGCRIFVQVSAGQMSKLDGLLRLNWSIRQKNLLLVFLLAKKSALR